MNKYNHVQFKEKLEKSSEILIWDPKITSFPHLEYNTNFSRNNQELL